MVKNYVVIGANQYFYEALKKIREKDPECKGAIDGGCFYIKKADLKNDNF